MTTANLVALPPAGITIALGYWRGDVDQALRLARLIGAIEPARRDDVVFAFCPRFDVEWDADQQATFLEVGRKFGVCRLPQSPPREHVDWATSHPDACNQMVASTLKQLAYGWRNGTSRAHSVFLCEPDGVPLRRDWIDVLKAEHEATLAAGKRVTGCWMRRPVPHYNGTLLAACSLWFDRPSIHETPSGGAWDLHHAAVLAAEGRDTRALANIYGAGDWTAGALAALAREVAWATSTKDLSMLMWAEQTLAVGPAPRDIGTDDTPPAGRRVHVNG